MKRIAIFDFDGTIIDINSTFAFVKFYLRKKSFVKFLIAIFLEEFSFLINYRKALLVLLENEEEGCLKLAARDFLITHRKYLNLDLLKQADALKKEGYFLYLVSGTFDFIVESFAPDICFDGAYGSTLEFREGKCTGNLSRDLLGQKKNLLLSVFNSSDIDFSQSYCFSDNKDDEDLLGLFGYPRAISHWASDTAFWRSRDVTVLPMKKTIPFNVYRSFFPFSYTLYSRRLLPPFIEKIFLMFYIIPQLLGFYFLSIHFSVANLLSFIVAVVAFYGIYELGYIMNDFVAFNEKNPTLRSTKLTNRDFSLVIVFALLSFSFFMYLEFFVFHKHVFIFITALFITSLVFLAHNLLREKSRMKIITFFFLRISKVIVPFAIVSNNLLYPAAFFFCYEFVPLTLYWIFYKKILSGEFNRLFHSIPFHFISFFVSTILLFFSKSLLFEYLFLVGLYFILLDVAYVCFKFFRK